MGLIPQDEFVAEKERVLKEYNNKKLGYAFNKN